MSYPLTKNQDGTVSWTHQDGDRYLVTGVDVRGRRFKRGPFENWHWAKGYNIFRGSRWLLRCGQRYLIERIFN